MKTAILLATTNKAKIGRVRKLLKVSRPEVKVDIPTDLGLEAIEVDEGNDLLDNARAKTRAYLGKTGLPIVGMDAGFFVDGEELDPALVKRNALEGRDESEFSQHEIGQRMLVFYQNIARNHGGQVEAYWKDVFVMVLPDGTEKVAESIRPVVLTTEVHGEVSDFMPLRSLYYSKDTGKYAAVATEEDENIELRPISDALLNLLA